MAASKYNHEQWFALSVISVPQKVFSIGWIANNDGMVFVYYANSDTRVHLATTTMKKKIDYALNTPEDAGRTQTCVIQRDQMVKNNLKIMSEKYTYIKF